MIRDAILTCARKPTRVSLIYRTEPKTVKRVNGTVLGSVWCVDRNPFTILRIKSWQATTYSGILRVQAASFSSSGCQCRVPSQCVTGDTSVTRQRIVITARERGSPETPTINHARITLVGGLDSEPSHRVGAPRSSFWVGET